MFVPTSLRLSPNFLLIFYCTVFLCHPHSKCIPANLLPRPPPSHFPACFSFCGDQKIQTFPFQNKKDPPPLHLRGNEYCKSNVWRLGFVNMLSVYLIFIKRLSLKWGGGGRLFSLWMHGCFCGMHPSFCSHLLLLLQKQKKKKEMQSGCADDWIQFVWTKKDW